MKKVILLFIVFSVFYSCSQDNTDELNNQSIPEETFLEQIDSSKLNDATQSESEKFNCDFVTELEVANLDDISTKEDEIIAHMIKNPLLKNVNNIRDVIYYFNKTDGNEYIEAVGDNQEGGFTSIRVKVQTKSISSGKYLLKIAMAFDTCSGVNCSKCSFNNDGGCDCGRTGDILGGASYCNHSTSC